MSSYAGAPRPIDLTTALPSVPAELGDCLQHTLEELAGTPRFGAAIRRNRPGGSSADREAGAHWLACRLGSDLSPQRVIATNGTQSALNLLLQAFVGTGGLIVAESLTYVVLKQIVARSGMQIAGVDLDKEGIIPDAFEALCRSRRPRALYCNPTIHNPTTAVMPEARRLQIAAVARRYNVLIFEDDVLGAVHRDAPKPIAALAPDITWYIMSLSKCFAMGLRMAYVAGPSAAAVDALVKPVDRLSSWFPSSLSAEVAGRWIRSGEGWRIADAMKREAESRYDVAAAVLHSARFATVPGALHLWLHLPEQWSRQSFTGAARREGVLVRPSDLFAVDASPPPEAVRVSLTGPQTLEELHAGLSKLACVLASAPDHPERR